MKLRSLFHQKMDEWSDMELLQAFQKKGKEEYFDALFERYHPLIYNICLNLTANREESKDLTLHVFTNIYDSPKAAKAEHFNYWIVALAKNICLSYIRNQLKEVKKKEKWWESEKNTQKFMENEAFRRLIYEEDLEKNRQFQKSFYSLPEYQRLCVDLFFLKGYSYKRIAQENKITEKQVKSHLQNGKRQMRKEVDSYYKEQENNA